MRAKLALLRIAAADQDEARRVSHAQSLALHHVFSRGRHVQEQVHEMVLEQVHLVDIEKPTVRARQQPGFEPFLPSGQGAFEIEGADHPILGGAQRQVDHGRADEFGLGPGAVRRLAMNWAAPGVSLWIAMIGTAHRRFDRRQKRSEGPHRRGLAGPAIPEHHHTADPLVDGGDQQGPLHLILTDDRRKRVRLTHSRTRPSRGARRFGPTVKQRRSGSHPSPQRIIGVVWTAARP